MNSVRICRLLLAAAQTLFLSGCATKMVWEAQSFNEPASDPHLALFLASQRKDVLVQYDEFRERSSAIRPRAFYLNQNLDRLEARKKPRFVAPKVARGLQPIPLSAPGQSPVRPPGVELYATANTNGPGFTLYFRGQELSSHELPTYQDGLRTAEQIALTPLAVVADVTIVGGLIVYACAYAYAQSPGSWSWCP